MKKLFILLVTQLISYSAWSQALNIHYKNGQIIQYNMDNVDYIEFTKEQNNSAQVSSEKAVDLGLSVKWASCNLGASSPEEFGDCFAWGETSPKAEYTKDNYAFYDSKTESYIDIGTDISYTEFDAAYVNWGDQWRMPTQDELWELKKNCTWTWSNVNGVNGYVVKGSNGNSIFFPVGAYTIRLWGCRIWNSDDGTNKEAETLVLKTGDAPNRSASVRYRWCWIRPVMP